VRTVFVESYHATITLNIAGPNRALNQPSTQISAYANMVSSKANDGDYQTSSNTGPNSFPWWSVDLGTSYFITAVNVTNDNNAYYGNIDVLESFIQCGSGCTPFELLL